MQLFTIVYISLYPINNQNKSFMKHFELFLMVSQFVLFVIVLGNIATLFTNYLLTKIK